MLQFHDNMLPVQWIIPTRVKHGCAACAEKLEAFITAAGDHWHCSRNWQVYSRASNFQKVGQHTGGKWLIHGTQRRKDNQSRSLELPCKISYMGTKIWQTIATCAVQYSKRISRGGNIPRGVWLRKQFIKHIYWHWHRCQSFKPMGWNINMCKSCLLIIEAEFLLLFTINLMMSMSLVNDNCVPYQRRCWSFSQKCQFNVIIYEYCATTLQINKSLLKVTIN